MGGGKVEIINSKGCSRLFVEFPSSFRGLQSFPIEPMSPASSVSAVSESPVAVKSNNGPFSGLVICVTGLSKEARRQVMEATERLGGQYSPHLHPQCTHLVVQSLHGRKYEHALKHGPRNGLALVTLGWFVDSVRRNVRLSESLYRINTSGKVGIATDDLKRYQIAGAENSCLPVGVLQYARQPEKIEGEQQCFQERKSKRIVGSPLSGESFYIDVDVSAELRSKVIEVLSIQGASLVDQWFIGCNATHIVCEGPSIRKYVGQSSNLVTPLWVLKTVKEKRLQRLVHLSADLARQIGNMLDTVQRGISGEGANEPVVSQAASSSVSYEERQKMVNLAKDGVRKRRGQRMQTCQTPMRPINPSRLLDSICWSISDPTSTASIYTESSSINNADEDHTSNGKEMEASFVNLTRPLTESEKSELITKSHFLTILFPVDRFSEMGPSSRTFFSEKGFTCLQVLDHIYAFYQENMLAQEIEIAMHTDSRHADRLRSAYTKKETVEQGYMEFKRIDFLGSRKNFEMLKHVTGDNTSTTYELLIGA